MTDPSPLAGPLSPELRKKITELQEEGYERFERFDLDVRQHEFHPFVPGNFERALEILLEARGEGGLKFLEWGSGMGVITIMADLVGFDAYGIELDGDLVRTARMLAGKYGSKATFCEGSLVPAGYVWKGAGGPGDGRMATLGDERSGYQELKLPLDEFDVVYGYPWDGEAPIMRDIMKRYGRADAKLMIATL